MDEIENNWKDYVTLFKMPSKQAFWVMEMRLENDKPVIENVHCAVDCGMLINHDAAANLAEGAIVDGIGNALYGELTFQDGVPQQSNFHQYRMIRMSEAPKQIQTYFVDNGSYPTGLGEPTFPPVLGALVNALYAATGRRFYDQQYLHNTKGLTLATSGSLKLPLSE